jgi:hypothetical protein
MRIVAKLAETTHRIQVNRPMDASLRQTMTYTQPIAKRIGDSIRREERWQGKMRIMGGLAEMIAGVARFLVLHILKS